LTWTAEEADKLGIDRDRIGLYGGSAGGCLAIGTALLARDRGGPPIVFLMTPYPMLDDRNETPSSHAILDFGVWDRAANLEAWRCVLGDAAGGEDVSPYAAPARASDLAGLPPTYIDVGDLDLFRDEDVAFALGLMEVGVPTELKVYPGVVHGGEAFAPRSRVSARILADRWEALRRALHPAVDDAP
jgi:acetyl esterase/lipase